MPGKFGDPASAAYGSLVVRGREVSITPGIINNLYVIDVVEEFHGEQEFDKIALF